MITPAGTELAGSGSRAQDHVSFNDMLCTTTDARSPASLLELSLPSGLLCIPGFTEYDVHVTKIVCFSLFEAGCLLSFWISLVPGLYGIYCPSHPRSSAPRFSSSPAPWKGISLAGSIRDAPRASGFLPSSLQPSLQGVYRPLTTHMLFHFFILQALWRGAVSLLN